MRRRHLSSDLRSAFDLTCLESSPCDELRTWLSSFSHMPQGELTSARNTTDAVKYRLDAETAARTLLIRETVNALNGDHVAAARYLIEMARVEQLKAIANGHNNSTFFLPTELLASLQAVADKINVPTKPS